MTIIIEGGDGYSASAATGGKLMVSSENLSNKNTFVLASTRRVSAESSLETVTTQITINRVTSRITYLVDFKLKDGNTLSTSLSGPCQKQSGAKF